MTGVEVSGADGLLGVERVVSVLRQRGYRLHRLSVDWDPDASSVWTLRCTVGEDNDPSLLLHRLARAVPVLDVRLDPLDATTGGVTR